MSDTTKMLLLTAGFFGLLIAMAVTRSIFLSYIIVAVVSAFVGSLLTEPYKVVSVEPKAKSIEVLEMEVER